MKPFATIIITCYNRQKYIKDAVLSAVHQYTTNPIEVIIVDDASDDNSREIIKELANHYPEIRPLYHTRNKGLLEATLTGLRNSSGQFVFLLDSDDILAKTSVDTCFRIFAANKDIAMVVHNCADIHDQQTFPVKERIPPTSVNARYGNSERFFEPTSEYVRAATYSAFDRNKTRLDDFVRETERFIRESGRARANQVTPMIAWVQAVNPHGIYWHPEVLYYRRIHSENSGSARDLAKMIFNCERAENSLEIALHLSNDQLPALQKELLETKLSATRLRKYALEAKTSVALSELLKLTAYGKLTPKRMLKLWIKTALLLTLGPEKYTRAKEKNKRGLKRPKISWIYGQESRPVDDRQGDADG